VSPDGASVYVSGEAGLWISIIDTVSLRVAGTIETESIGLGLSGVAVSPDGRWIFSAGAELLDCLYVISAAANRVEGKLFLSDAISSSYPVRGLAVSPNGKWLYVAYFRADTVLVVDISDFDTIEVVADVPVITPRYIATSPDGQWIYVTGYNTQTLTVIREATHQVVGTVRVGGFPLGVAVKP
jgi:YVTN family beta-propeller protein